MHEGDFQDKSKDKEGVFDIINGGIRWMLVNVSNLNETTSNKTILQKQVEKFIMMLLGPLLGSS